MRRLFCPGRLMRGFFPPTLRWMLFGGFSLLLVLLVAVGLFAIASQRQAVDALEKILSVDIREADLSQDVSIAMMRARRNEKDFLLSQQQFGFDEARSRYVTLFRINMRDAHTMLTQMRLLPTSPAVAGDLAHVLSAINAYEEKFLTMVELYRQLGYVDTGLEGAFREKARQIEALSGDARSPVLQRDGLSMRRHEKDFVQRRRDSDRKLLGRAVDTFKADLELANDSQNTKKKLALLVEQYHSLFEQYGQTYVQIDGIRRDYLTALQVIEPTLEVLEARARDQSDATRTEMRGRERRAEVLITATTFAALVIGMLVAWLTYRRVIQSLLRTVHFARRIAENELTARVERPGHDEFGALDTALNRMADALQHGKAMQETKTAELVERNNALDREIAARMLAESQLLEANDALERRVAKRTEQLRLANARLQKDIEVRMQAERALAVSEERFRHLTQLSSDWYWEQDAQYRFTLMSRDQTGMNGKFLQEYLGKTLWEILTMLSESSWEAHKATLAAQAPFTDFEYPAAFPGAQLRWFSVSGKPLFDATNTFIGYRGIGRDITERKEAEKQIRHLALHDALTGLPNRPLLHDRLQKAIADASRHGHAIWVLFIDLDRFKYVNDSLGHKAGDMLLTTIAGRLQATLRDNDTVARIGGDEFLLVLQDSPEKSLTTGTFQRILEAVAAPVTLEGQSVVISCSIGAAVYPHDGTTAERLMEHADAAMYRAKQSGGNNFQFYAAEAHVNSGNTGTSTLS